MPVLNPCSEQDTGKIPVGLEGLEEKESAVPNSCFVVAAGALSAAAVVLATVVAAVVVVVVSVVVVVVVSVVVVVVVVVVVSVVVVVGVVVVLVRPIVVGGNPVAAGRGKHWLFRRGEVSSGFALAIPEGWTRRHTRESGAAQHSGAGTGEGGRQQTALGKTRLNRLPSPPSPLILPAEGQGAMLGARMGRGQGAAPDKLLLHTHRPRFDAFPRAERPASLLPLLCCWCVSPHPTLGMGGGVFGGCPHPIVPPRRTALRALRAP